MNQQSLPLPTACGALIALCLALVGVFTVESHASGAQAIVLVVNSVGDESDADLSDDICITSQGECTLRAAIEQANDTANADADTPDEIGFDIVGPGVHTILPLFPLPAIIEAVRIDGYTQGTAEFNTLDVGSDALLKIEIDGSVAGGLTFGVTLKSSGSTIRGLVINRFGQANVLLDGANENHIEGNYIGTDATGTSARPNGADGIALFDSASNVIGGATPDKRNVISGNAWNGVAILNGPSQGNIVEGNYIGTDPSGLNDVGNGRNGVLISAVVGVNVYASNNRIGGVGTRQRNVISGNGWSGVQVFRGTRNEILGNLIGTKVDGTTRLPNQNDGVLLNEASDNLVGGQFVGDGSGNIAAFGRNILSGNNGRGITIFVGSQSASRNRVMSNFIGTDITGLQPIPNNGGGVLLGSGVGATGTVTDNIIGGIDGSPATRNIISGNGSSGVSLVGPRVTTNEIVGNFIGLDQTGAAKLGNTLDGVRFTTFGSQSAGPTGNFIGTSTSTGGNVISGNGRDGVAIAFGSAGNLVVNNIIGLDDAGSGTDPDGIPLSGDELGNSRHGVAIFDSPGNFVGFGSAVSRNVISSNHANGVFISGIASTGNKITSNYIGVGGAGSVGPTGASGFGNLGDGILIDGAPDNVIGGATAVEGNIVSRNNRDGVHITGANATGNKLFRNLIGVESDASTDSGNRRHGVFIGDGASNNTIGDVTDGMGNVIAFNDVSGVAVESGTGNAIRGNQIFDNAGLGIDLGGDGLTDNDPGDDDPGPNNLQNFPIVTVEELEDGNTHVKLVVDMAGATTFQFDFYANETGDGISAGQGRTYLRSETVTTTPSGTNMVSFSIRGEHRNITVTATDPNGNTSEFGREPFVHSVEFTQAIQILQPTNLFLSKLDEFGEPPVPMIAGKEGVMRIYLRNVAADTEVFFVVEGAGFKRNIDSVTTKPGCSPESRRISFKGECTSVNFYFTPPQGEWDVTLTLKNPTPGPAIGTVFERHRIHQFTRTAKTLVIKAAGVCHDKDTNGKWICGDHTVLKNLSGLLKSIAPTHKVRVDNVTHKARYRLTMADRDNDGLLVSKIVDAQGDLYERDLWRLTVFQDLSDYNTLTEFLPRLLGTHANEQRYIVGVTKPIEGITAGGSMVIGGTAARMKESVQVFKEFGGIHIEEVTLAHEVFHLLGREHTNRGFVVGSPPGCWGRAPSNVTDWPFCDSKIRSLPVTCNNPPCACEDGVFEIPFDVARSIPFSARFSFDIMSYCTPAWIAPINYVGIANDGLAPFVPQMLTQTAGTPGPVAGTFWLVAGKVENGKATIRPLFQLDTIGLDTPREGSHRIEIRDVSEVLLFTRFFEPQRIIEETDDPEFFVPRLFSELIPKHNDAHSIVVIDDHDVELGRITLGGVAPTVTVDYSPGSEPQSGLQTIGWTIVDPDSSEHTVWVHYSNDNGLTWHYVGVFGTLTQVTLNFDNLPGADGSCIFRVLASDGMNTGFGDSDPFSVAKKLPQVEILFPEDGTVFRRGELVWLQSSASDGDDGTLDDTAVVWTSSIAGNLGQGEDLPLPSLGIGVHTITVTLTDSDGNVATHSIIITVEDSPLVEVVPVIHVPADQPTIQAGIDAAFPGGEVLVAPGTYNEIIDFHGKTITLRSSGGADVTIIDATSVVDPGDGKPVVRCDSGEGPNTVLDGFTITGGTGDTGLSGAAVTRGGGMFNNGSSPTVTNCTFSGNAVSLEGGGMANIVSSPTVTNCTFDGNSAQTGGGMSNIPTSDPIVTNCQFSGNIAEQFGGGIFNNSSSPTVTNCKFNGNVAELGGGMYSVFGDPTVTNCMFTGNEALSDGGGMMNRVCSPTVTGCTFGGNTALSDGGGMNNLDTSDPAITNCIFWMNSDLGGADESGQIHNADTLGPNFPTVNFSDIQGGWTGLGGVGNINVDPQFMDADGPDNQIGTADDDLRLQPGSPCIDSGDPAFVASSGETDLDGHNRVLCDRVEMGAYEFAGDFACDQTIDLDDFTNWDACMTGPGGGPYAPGCATFDCDADSDIDMQDFAVFGSVFSP